ncbi:MAG: phosphoglucosamine mutase, partial [Syntrophaceae bacterium]|nr:phosphoglucosamine mutase [Syntrophaceae bacterium]
LIGKDTRLSSDMLEMALASGLCSVGIDAVLAGHLPTPGVAFLTRNMRCVAGVVVSASHNPFGDNGIKFFSSSGYKLSNDVEIQIEKLLESQPGLFEAPTGAKVGKTISLNDSVGRYVVFLKSCIPSELSFDDFKIVIDCANGAAYQAAPLVFQELGADVKTIAKTPDGTNINDECGSLHPEKLCGIVKDWNADLGVALDGDADRAIFSDENGNVVDGDKIMGLIAKYLSERGELKKNTLVSTVMSNMGLEVAMRSIGVKLLRTQVGDKFVVEKMLEEGLNFGGEQSGHLIFLDHNTSGDGILSALQVLRVIKQTGKKLSELASLVDKFPQVLENVEVTCRKDIESVPQIKKVMDECRVGLGAAGRILVRYSGTQPLCRIMAEGENEQKVKWAVDLVKEAITRHL